MQTALTINRDHEFTNPLKLFYSQEAGDDWNRALLLSNGCIGAMGFGNLHQERIPRDT
jgi:hypothetical protein